MGKLTLMLITVQLISKVFGFFREITLSYFYGASDISDAYLICTTIPIVIFTFIGTGLSTSFIPVYSEIYYKEGNLEAEKFTTNLINLMTIICSVIIFFCLIFTLPIIKIFASGFSKELIAVTVKFTRLSIWGIYFSTLIFIGSSYLQMKNKYLLPPLTGIVFNSLIIFSIFLSSKSNPRILALGTVIAIAIQSIIIIIGMVKNGFKYSFFIDHRDSYITHLFYLTIPVIFGISASQINVLIDRTISSRIAVGGISTLVYASRLSFFIQTIFVTTITTIIFPKITKLASENKMDMHKQMFKKSLISISVMLFPITVGSMIFSEPIIKLLYGRGAFNDEALRVTSRTLYYYSIGIVGTGFREVLLKVFYSLEDTKSSTKNSTISVGLNIILNIILSKYMGIAGLALATSISSTFCAVLLFISLRKKIGPFGTRALSSSFFKIFIASLLTGITAKLSYLLILRSLSQNLAFITAVTISVFCYIIIIYSMKIKDVNKIIVIYGGKVIKSIIRFK